MSNNSLDSCLGSQLVDCNRHKSICKWAHGNQPNMRTRVGDLEAEGAALEDGGDGARTSIVARWRICSGCARSPGARSSGLPDDRSRGFRNGLTGHTYRGPDFRAILIRCFHNNRANRDYYRMCCDYQHAVCLQPPYRRHNAFHNRNRDPASSILSRGLNFECCNCFHTNRVFPGSTGRCVPARSKPCHRTCHSGRDCLHNIHSMQQMNCIDYLWYLVRLLKVVVMFII